MSASARMLEAYQAAVGVVAFTLSHREPELLGTMSVSDRCEMLRELGVVVTVALHTMDAPSRRERQRTRHEQRELGRLHALIAKHAKDDHTMHLEAPDGATALIRYERSDNGEWKRNAKGLRRLTAERQCLHARVHAVLERYTKQTGIALHRLVGCVLATTTGKHISDKSIEQAFRRIPLELRSSYTDAERHRLLSAFGLGVNRRILPFSPRT